jgi:hypothetical protein
LHHSNFHELHMTNDFIGRGRVDYRENAPADCATRGMRSSEIALSFRSS